MVDEGYFKVVLTGPKGIGKSVTTAVLFLLMQSMPLLNARFIQVSEVL